LRKIKRNKMHKEHKIHKSLIEKRISDVHLAMLMRRKFGIELYRRRWGNLDCDDM